MAQKRIRDLTRDTAPSLNDLLESCKNPSGTPLSRAVAINYILGLLREKTLAVTEEDAPGGSDLFLFVVDPGGTPVLKSVSIDTLGALFAAGGGGAEPVEEHEASASASLAFTASVSAAADSYRVVLENLLPASNNCALILEFSSDGGSTWDTGNNYSVVAYRASKVGSAADGGTAQGRIVLTGEAGGYHVQDTAALGGVCGEIIITNPLSASIYTRVTGVVSWDDATSSPDIILMVSGKHRVAAADNAFRLRFANVSGAVNIASGAARCYPILKAS